MQVNYNDIIFTLKNTDFNEEEYNNIIKICYQKNDELNDNYYTNKIYELNYNFIKLIKKIHFNKKMNDSSISFDIKFNYEFFIITLSHKQTICADFHGLSKDNYINIIDLNQETCYNLFGNNMISKFKNIINLDLDENEIKNMIIHMFQVYQPDELIKW
jgi:hypothetical protein